QIHIVIDVHERMVARLLDYGLVLPDGLAELLTCEGMVDVLYCRGGLPLDATPATYTPNRALRRAVKLRDGGCVHPSCALPAHRCQVHHIVSFPTGPTTLWNLCCLCRYHHRQLHLGAFAMVRLADGTLEFTKAAPGGQRTVIGAAKLKLPAEPPSDQARLFGSCRAECGGEPTDL